MVVLSGGDVSCERGTPVAATGDAGGGSVLGTVETTRGPSWGHPRVVLRTIGSFLEPFCWHLSPNIDKVSWKLTLKYPAKGLAWRFLRVPSSFSSLLLLQVLEGLEPSAE